MSINKMPNNLQQSIATRHKQLPSTALAMVAALLLALWFAVPVMASEPSAPVFLIQDGVIQDGVMQDGETLHLQGPRQLMGDDLTVEEGEIIDDDVFLYSGNVEVKEGGRITGDLVVISGNIDINEGASVDGDVTTSSGNINVAGYVGGDVANLSGNIDLESTARVDGDISVVSGSIERDDGASVGGNVVKGPSFGFRAPPDAPDAPRAPAGIRFESESPSFFGRIINFIGRLFMAALITAFTMLLVGGLFYLRPQLIADTRRQLNEHLALSAVVGVLANLTVLFLAGLLAVTICLLPLALLPMLLLLAVNVVGWAVASQIVGERIVTIAKQQVQPALTILVGALFLTGLGALLWAFGGCFRPLAFLFILAVSSLGTGAVLVPWINRRRGIGGMGNNGDDGLPPSAPLPSGPAPTSGEAVDRDVAAPLDYVTAEEINAAGRGTSVQGTSAAGLTVVPVVPPPVGEKEVAEQEVVEHDMAAPIDYLTAEEINATAEQAPAAPTSRKRTAKTLDDGVSTAPAATEEVTVEQDVAAPIDYVTAQEVNTAETVTEGDDFLRIKGIGPTYARRLKDAGFATFAQVAAASPEDIASAIGWPVDRVRRAEVIDQAKVLAQ